MSPAGSETFVVERTSVAEEPLAIVAARPEDLIGEPDAVASELRCESCGAPVDEAGLCHTCERIFRKVLQPKPAAPAAAVPPPIPVPPPPAPPPIARPVMPPPMAFAPVAPATEPKAQPRRTVPPPKPVAPPKSPRHLGWFGAIAVVVLAAAAVVAVAVPLSQQWLERQWGGPLLTSEESAAAFTAAEDHTPASAPAASAEGATTVAPARAEAPRPKPVTGNPAPRKTTRAAANRTSTPKAPASDAEAAPPAAPAPLVAETVAAPEPVAPAPAPEPVVVPVGQVFERAQVNEPPRVESQVEPSVPTTLQGRPLDDVVILRVLVSHTGRPATINVLRKSKSGAPLDEAVVAAVKRWTFAPAQRRGQAVSCWFNVGVPVKRAPAEITKARVRRAARRGP